MMSLESQEICWCIKSHRFGDEKKVIMNFFVKIKLLEGLELERASPEITDNVGLAGATDSTSPFQVFLQ